MPWKSATAPSEILSGGGTLGGAPPALAMTWGGCCLGRTRAEEDAARRVRAAMVVECIMIDLVW